MRWSDRAAIKGALVVRAETNTLSFSASRAVTTVDCGARAQRSDRLRRQHRLGCRVGPVRGAETYDGRSAVCRTEVSVDGTFKCHLW